MLLVKHGLKIVLSNTKVTPFKYSRPGDKWYNGFQKQYPDFSHREPLVLTKSRDVITEKSIRKWFWELQNGDETSLSMCPKRGKVLAPKGWKNVFEVNPGSEKETVTVLLVFSAHGDVLHAMLIFPHIRPPASAIRFMPPTWFLRRSESGGMRSEVLYE